MSEVKQLDIPEFLKAKMPDENEPMEDEISAVLNNVPGNVEIEEINHLNELKQVCKNWKEEEWKRVLLSAPSEMMAEEMKRRLTAFEDYVRNQRNNMSTLEKLDL